MTGRMEPRSLAEAAATLVEGLGEAVAQAARERTREPRGYLVETPDELQHEVRRLRRERLVLEVLERAPNDGDLPELAHRIVEALED